MYVCVCVFKMDVCVFKMDVCVFKMDVCVFKIDVCMFKMDVCTYLPPTKDKKKKEATSLDADIFESVTSKFAFSKRDISTKTRVSLV